MITKIVMNLGTYLKKVRGPSNASKSFSLAISRA